MTLLPDSELNESLERLRKSIEERDSQKEYQLAFWQDPQRGIPNEFARSALFAAVPLNTKKALLREPIYSQQGFVITFTGVQLNQADLDVFEGVMHLARSAPENTKIRFKAGTLLRIIGRRDSKNEYEWLLTSLNKLTSATLGIERDRKKVYWGSILPEGAANLDNGEFVIQINRQLIGLFERGFTTIEWAQRKQLTKKPLAQHLHAWLCSHDRPYPVTVAYLHQICGSETKEMRRFRQALKQALDDIQSTGAISTWWIDEDDKVHLTKTR